MTTLEFAAVRASVAQAVKQAEQARQLRIEGIDRQLPSDPYTMQAPTLKIASMAVVILGGGMYGLWKEGEGCES